MKITVSELKQPWSVLLQSKNSAIFRAETAIIRTENLWSLLKITQHRLTFMKISSHYWKCLRPTLNIYENLWSSLWRPKHSCTTREISARLWKCLSITQNYCLNSDMVWKTSVNALHCQTVFDLCFINFLRTTFRENPRRKRKYLLFGAFWIEKLTVVVTFFRSLSFFP